MTTPEPYPNPLAGKPMENVEHCEIEWETPEGCELHVTADGTDHRFWLSWKHLDDLLGGALSMSSARPFIQARPNE